LSGSAAKYLQFGVPAVVTEIWKDISGYAGHYQASNLGNIRSVDRMIQKGSHQRFSRGVVLKPMVTFDGYKQVSLSLDAISKSYKVHQLVARTFIPKTGTEINHIDGDKLNNRLENLEWCTRGENISHCFRLGLRTSAGTANGRAKVTPFIAAEIRSAWNTGATKTDIAHRFGLGRSTVCSIINMKRWI
jgi:hypothetical protein